MRQRLLCHSPVHSLAVLEQLWHSLMHPWRGPSVENLQFSCNDYRLFTIQVWMHNSKVQFKDQCCQSQCSNHRGPDDRMGQQKRLVILHLVHSPNMHPVNNRGTSNCQAYSCNVWIKDTFISIMKLRGVRVMNDTMIYKRRKLLHFLLRFLLLFGLLR